MPKMGGKWVISPNWGKWGVLGPRMSISEERFCILKFSEVFLDDRD